jgi:hypothetical protein
MCTYIFFPVSHRTTDPSGNTVYLFKDKLYSLIGSAGLTHFAQMEDDIESGSVIGNDLSIRREYTAADGWNSYASDGLSGNRVAMFFSFAYLYAPETQQQQSVS